MATPPNYGRPNLPLIRETIPTARSVRTAPLPRNLHIHNRRSVDENGDRSRRHLASSRAPGDHGAPLPANVDDWTSACELEQHIVPGPTLRRFEANNSPPLTQVAGPQSWSGAFNAATEMALRQPQLVAAAVNKSQLSAQDVAVEKQPTLSEMQRPVPVAGPRQLSSTGEAQQPTTSIGARKPQISEPLDRPHTISKDQKLVGTNSSVSHPQLGDEHVDVVAREDTEAAPLPKRRISIRRSITRRASRALKGTLTALRRDPEEMAPETEEGNDLMAKWRDAMLRVEEDEKMNRHAFASFLEEIEEIYNSIYTRLRGEGNFLVDDHTVTSPAELQAKLPIELSAETNVSAKPTDEERAWLSASKKEERIVEFRDPHTGSVQRSMSPWTSTRFSENFMICSPQRFPHTAVLESGLTYVPDHFKLAEDIRSELPELVVKGGLPNESELAKDEMVGIRKGDERPQTPSPSKASRLPRLATASSGQYNDAPLDEVSNAPTAPKGRKDSVQPGASRSTQSRDRYPKIRAMPKR